MTKKRLEKCEAEPDMISVSDVKKMLETRKQYALQKIYGVVDQTIYEEIRALFEVNL